MKKNIFEKKSEFKCYRKVVPSGIAGKTSLKK